MGIKSYPFNKGFIIVHIFKQITDSKNVVPGKEKSYYFSMILMSSFSISVQVVKRT